MRSLVVILATGLAIAAPVPDDLAKPVGIQCRDQATYIGGIDRHYTLTISGPKEKSWKYTFEMQPGVAKITLAGSYEIVDDLVLFTGKANDQGEIRFGLNYGFPAGQVEFNGFFAAGDGTLRYHRKWFRNVNGQWQPAKEVILSMPRAALAGGGIRHVEFKGERVVWDQAGQPRRDQIDVKVPYRREGEHFSLHMPPANLADVIPALLAPRQDAVLLGLPGGPDGFLRGFRPNLQE